MKSKLIYILVLLSSLSAFGQGQPAATQSIDDDDIVNLEGVYSAKPVPPPKKDEELPSQLKEQKQTEVKELKDLNKLAPFSEVSVIQKKFLPKTERFQFFVGPALMTNTPWYNNVGAKLHLGYNFTESLGLEISSMFMTHSERDSVKEIRDNNGLQADQFIYTKSYYGLDLVWSPIYGKMTSLDRQIIPFDMYFSLGGGASQTNSQEGSNGTLHVGLGQIFAISKAVAFRWDYSLHVFSATPVATSSSSTPSSGNYNDLVLSAGVSFFFPEATYR